MMPRFLSKTLAAGLLLVSGQALSASPPAYRQEVVVAGSPFQGVHGLALDGKGHLLASNLLGQSVHSIDLNTGAVTTLVGPPLGGADDVTLGPDGSIYWTGFFSGRLMRRTPDGKTRVIAKDLPGLNSLAFRRDGRFYVTQLGRGDALWEVDPSGHKPPRQILSGLGFLNGFEFGPDDRLYGPLLLKRQIARVNVDTGAIEVVAEGFAMPTAANFDSRRENLYVVDAVRGELVRVRVATGDKEVVAKLPTGLDNLTVGPDDQVYVSNMVDNDIRVVNPADGSIRPLVEARLSVPSGLAVAPDDPDENLYVADVYALRRVGGRDGKISQTTRVLSTRMTFPMQVSLGAKHVVLSSAYLGNVQVLDRDSGEVLRTIPNTNGVQGVLELRRWHAARRRGHHGPARAGGWRRARGDHGADGRPGRAGGTRGRHGGGGAGGVCHGGSLGAGDPGAPVGWGAAHGGQGPEGTGGHRPASRRWIDRRRGGPQAAGAYRAGHGTLHRAREWLAHRSARERGPAARVPPHGGRRGRLGDHLSVV